jgi:hypothetical protein
MTILSPAMFDTRSDWGAIRCGRRKEGGREEEGRRKEE